MSSCEPRHAVAMHGTEPCQTKNDPMLTEAAEATIHDMMCHF